MKKDFIVDMANEILSRSPGVVVRYRLLRDILCKESDDNNLMYAKISVDSSTGIKELAAEQREDGGWGAFHSMNTHRKQRTLTTEMGVERALALGLDATHPIMIRASNYILNILQGNIAFPDRPEKNNRWQTGERLFLASTLARIQPSHPILNIDRILWVEIAKRTLRSGRYNQEEEILVHEELTGASVKDSYLVLGNIYQLIILGSQPGLISPKMENALLRWIWEKPGGIGYLNVPLNCNPPKESRVIDRWLASLELLARLFPSWSTFSDNSIDWLLNQADVNGFWDFGPLPTRRVDLPLSENWRIRQDRKFDWTTRVLSLLKLYSQEGKNYT